MTALRLGSRYLLDERIGEGGLGVVWRGRDAASGAQYAIKLLRAEYSHDPEMIARFVRERTALLRFRHPNVVLLHDMIVEGDRLALVMDYLAGGDLNAYRQRCGGTLPTAVATSLVGQACAALAAAHAAGIVHRDLKPANILLDADPAAGGSVRLTDFGIARLADETRLTTTGVVVGTIAYLAPEVLRGGTPTPGCDVYAAGVTLYELLGGQPPFTGRPVAVMYAHLEQPPPRPAGLRDDLWALISACLAKDPAERPGAADLAAMLGVPYQAAPTIGRWPAMEYPMQGPTEYPVQGPAEYPGQGPTDPGTPQATTAEAALPGNSPGRRARFQPGWLVAGAAAAGVLAVAGALTTMLLRSPGPAGSGAPPASPSVTTSGAAPPPSLSGTTSGTPATTATPAATRAPAASASATTGAVPARIGWDCGPTEAATLYKTGAGTGQTLQACIRLHDGRVQVEGILKGVRPAADEQIRLIIKNQKQVNHGVYTSQLCRASTCAFTRYVNLPTGTWTVLPQWFGYDGSYESTGREPGFVAYSAAGAS